MDGANSTGSTAPAVIVAADLILSGAREMPAA